MSPYKAQWKLNGMKQIAILLALVVGIGVVAGCAGPAADEPPPVTNPDQKADAAGTPPAQLGVD